ncbi:uncharacterized protein LOC105839973 isoform X4 [Monomorium pharaonis]|uniref:uncharacterized protein LOC105839973 isoform X4 n=1 Tax=Monomorium pharaonis TaxID=307658 RepID=UPI001746EC85|nr:uncharacterized protein LOC105839973 isoform X4 [Monomorium pharaonis]
MIGTSTTSWSNCWHVLTSILILLEMEQSQDYKIEKNKNHYLPNEINFDRFLHEGVRYLSMVNNLNSWVLPNNTKNMILRKTLSVLEKIQFQYKRMIRMRNLLLNGIIANGIREDIIITMDNVIQETDELRIGTADEYDIDEYEVIEFYDWQSETKIRTVLLRMINLLIDKIYHTIIKRFLTLHSMVKEYCKRAMQFLRSNKKILKSSKFCRRQGHNSCYKYYFLKQLIACCHYISN